MPSTDSDFSIKTNDKQAGLIAGKLLEHFPAGSINDGNYSGLCDYLATYAKLSYPQTLSILHRIGYKSTPFDTLRLSYALLHYEETNSPYLGKGRFTAHAKILKVTADRLQSSNPQICLSLLLTSSAYAGCLVDSVMAIRDAVRLQKKIYCGRSRALSGRSLLEFVGALCTIKMDGDTVQDIDASKEEKKLNKSLCADRARADTECQTAPLCVQCGKRRAECRLSVRL